jgi:hypothetical protein
MLPLKDVPRVDVGDRRDLVGIGGIGLGTVVAPTARDERLAIRLVQF